MNFDLARSLRRIKPHRRAPRLHRRPDEALVFAERYEGTGTGLMLDTCVYVDVLQRRVSEPVRELLRRHITHHSTVCLAELTFAFGRLDPDHPGTEGALDALADTLDDIPRNRLTRPSERAFAEAGMLVGLAVRLGWESHGSERALLNDAALFLHAQEQGLAVLTRNIGDFDALDQLCPAIPPIFYRPVMA